MQKAEYHDGQKRIKKSSEWTGITALHTQIIAGQRIAFHHIEKHRIDGIHQYAEPYRINQTGNKVGFKKSVHKQKGRLKNIFQRPFNESKKTLESLYNASQFFYDSVSGFNGKNFGELYQFMADKLQQLQEFKAQGNNCFIFNSINFDNFIENTPKPTEVLIYYNGYNRDFSDFELKQLLCRGYKVKVRLFKNDQFSFDTVIESLIDLHDFYKKVIIKNDYKLLLCKAEFGLN